jgi:ribonuclease PH
MSTSAGAFVELQGTAEGKPFARTELDALLGLADGGIRELFEAQARALGIPASVA